MPLLQSIVHRLDPSLDGERLTLTAAPSLAESDDPAMTSLVNTLNDTYNTKAKGGHFAEGNRLGPLLAWLRDYKGG